MRRRGKKVVTGRKRVIKEVHVISLSCSNEIIQPLCSFENCPVNKCN